MAGSVARGVEDPVQIGLEGVEHGEPVVGPRGIDAEVAGVGATGGEIAVADVVDQARVAVDGHQVVAPGTGQEERGYGEILVRCLVEGAGYGAVGLRLPGTGHHGPPGAGTA